MEKMRILNNQSTVEDNDSFIGIISPYTHTQPENSGYSGNKLIVLADY